MAHPEIVPSDYTSGSGADTTSFSAMTHRAGFFAEKLVVSAPEPEV